MRWTSWDVMAGEYNTREKVSHLENKLMALDRCTTWCTTGVCAHGKGCKYVHIS